MKRMGKLEKTTQRASRPGRPSARRAAVSERERRFHEVLENLQDVYYEVTPEGTILEVSPSIALISGYGREDVLGKNLFDFYADHEIRRRLLERFNSQGWVSDYEVVLKDQDGTAVPCSISARLVRDGNDARIVGTMRDMRQRKRLDGLLQAESETRRTLTELSALLISEHNIGNITEHVLQSALRLTASPLGFVGFIDPGSGHLVAPTMTRDIWESCQVPGKTYVFEHFRGLWGWVLEQRKPLLSNRPGDDPRSGGIPPGHLPIDRFLAVPVLDGQTLKGGIFLANKKEEYIQEDLSLLQRIAALYAIALQRKEYENEKERLILELQVALAQVKQLSGLLPICASCKKVRDDQGYWTQIEEYVADHSEADFSHGLCPDCLKKLYPDLKK
jgi:PAS domain S-box-containing protein